MDIENTLLIEPTKSFKFMTTVKHGYGYNPFQEITPELLKKFIKKYAEIFHKYHICQ